MSSKTVRLPQDAIVGLLKALPENVLRDVFWRVFTEVDDSPLNEVERSALAAAEAELERGETVRWEDLQ
jgi:hypothetical protein